MEGTIIDWGELKSSDYIAWRKALNEKTLELLTAPDNNLSSCNNYGFFHRVREAPFFEQMESEWNLNKKIPSDWVSKGEWVGIWTALFDPCNTYSIRTGPIYAIRFYMKDNYHIYNPKSPEHISLWKEWPYKEYPNPWEETINNRGKSLSQRIEESFPKCPNHKRFFEESGFGAFIGYSDYVSAVIVLEGSVENAEFLYL